ncbi:MAG: diguanylate cyclase, partial [Candidatus Omnitrophica bacterium]|nr:diguanylate cyclase [Candidatus Omnitrophota bacterium]
IARYGGDEFVIILKGLDKDKVITLWENARQALAQKDFILPQGAQHIKVTMSIGLGEYPHDGKTIDALFERADEALYSSKRLGRNRISFAKDSLEQIREEKRIHNILLKPPFVYREKELAEVKSHLFAKEPHKLVLVESGIGCGKSRFLEEAADLARKQNTPAFSFSLAEVDRSKPYGILVDIITAISYDHHELFKKAYESLKPKEQQALCVFPQLRSFIGEAQPIGHWDTEARSNLFQGLSGILEVMLLELKPLILLDNIDWLDEATSGVFSYIIVSKKYTPLCILASDSRPDTPEQKRHSFLDTLLEEVSEFEIVPHIKLAPFTDGESSELIKKIFSGRSVPQDFIDDVVRIVKGNPLFIVELLRDLLSRGVIYLKYPTWVFNEKKEPLPHDLRELLTNKFKHLDQEEKELLLAAAGIGGNFKFDFLSKLKKINEGYVEDIISRAVDKNIFNKEAAGQEATLAFNNELSRGILYQSLDEESRKSLHENIATTLESEHKDDIEGVSPLIVFHYTQADLQTKVREYAPLAASYADKLFSDVQTEKIIEEAIRSREERDKQEPIKDESWPRVEAIVAAFNSAVKSMHLYQQQNEITQKMITRCFQAIQEYFRLQYNLTFSNPQGEAKEFTRFLINGQEFPESGFVEKLIGKQFVSIMRDFDIGSITFRKSIYRDELERFINILSDPKAFSEKKEKWQKLLTQHKVNSVKIDEVVYRRVLSDEEKKEFQKEVIKDLLAKKVLGSEMAAGASGASVGAGPEILDKKIRQVTGEEKNILAKTIARLPADIVVETIANEYTTRKNNLSDVKDMVKVCLSNSQNRPELIARLKEHLEGLGMSREAFEWMIDDTDFLKYPTKKRANIYINSDSKTILEIGVEENLKSTIAELFSVDEGEVARNIINKYLDNLKNPAEELRAYMANTLSNILETIPEKAAVGYVQKIVSMFLEALNNEEDALVYGLLVKNTDFLVYKLLKLEDYQSIYKIISAVKAQTAKDFTPDWKRIEAKKAMQEMDVSVLNKHLIALLDKAAFLEEKNELILGLLKALIPQSIDPLLDVLKRRASGNIPFEWYQQNLEIIRILKDHKNEVLPQIENMLGEESGEKVELALHILKNFRDESLLYLYEKALASTKGFIRKRALEALLELDTGKSLLLIEKAFPRETRDTQKDIIISLGEHSRNAQALDFLTQLKGLKAQVYNKKEIQKGIQELKKRIG